MDREALLRMVDTIHRNRDISKEVVFQSLEEALATAVRKRLGADDDLVCEIDRETGEIVIEDEEGEYELDMEVLGRIAAQAFKQVMMQRIREAERDVLFDDYEERVGSLVHGTVQRFEGDTMVVNLGKTEAYLPREERVRGESFSIGDRIRAIVLEVRKDGPRVRIIVSRSHPDIVRRLFELEVPEIADEIIDIKRIVREPGYRTKMAVLSSDPKIDAIGACVGVRGSRIKAVIDELRGEKIDIIRWSDSLETLIQNGLKPAVINIDNIYPDVDLRSATVLVDEDQQSLAIGKKGQNVRLASRLCGWDIEIKTRAEFEADQMAVTDEAEGELSDDDYDLEPADTVGDSLEAEAPEREQGAAAQAGVDQPPTAESGDENAPSESDPPGDSEASRVH